MPDVVSRSLSYTMEFFVMESPDEEGSYLKQVDEYFEPQQVPASDSRLLFHARSECVTAAKELSDKLADPASPQSKQARDGGLRKITISSHQKYISRLTKGLTLHYQNGQLTA